MKQATILSMALLLITAPAAFGQEEHLLHVSGHSWETGGFPPSDVGDSFNAVGVLNDIEPPIVWDTANYSYTWHVADLVSVGENVFGSIRVATYSGGTMEIWVDLLPSDHDYGTNPPNATSPSSFVNGISTYLTGVFTEFQLTFNTLSQSGNFNGSLDFTGGDVFPLLFATDGWTFGANLANVSPTGYDLQLNGDVYLTIVSVEEASWGGIKSLYR